MRFAKSKFDYLNNIKTNLFVFLLAFVYMFNTYTNNKWYNPSSFLQYGDMSLFGVSIPMVLKWIGTHVVVLIIATILAVAFVVLSVLSLLGLTLNPKW